MHHPNITIENKDILYPSSDNQPMADNTLQFDTIVKIKTNLDIHFEDQEVFVAGNLFWYPVKGKPKKVVAPDVMVAFGRPKGYRYSYKQWEEDNIAPAVAIEILSEGNTTKEMTNKSAFYQEYRVEEFIIIDPYQNTLSVSVREDDLLVAVDLPAGIWKSERLGITIEEQEDAINFYFPDGQPFRMPEQWRKELEKALLAKQQAVQLAENERLAKEAALQEIDRLKAELEQLKKG